MAVMDPALEKFKEIAAILDRDTATPDEVGEAMYAMLEILVKVQNEAKDRADAALASALSADVDLYARVQRLLEASAAESIRGDKKLQKTIDSLTAWKDRQEALETEEDVSTALDLADANAAEIARIKVELKDLSRGPGRRGPRGPIPDHEWEDTSIRFQNPDGSWGEWVDLKGAPGGGNGGFFGFGGGPVMGVRRIKGGTNIIVSGDPGEPTISAITSGGSFTVLTPSGVVNSVNTAFDFGATAPRYIIADGIILGPTDSNGNTQWTGTTAITMINPPSTSLLGIQ